jgi:hypothetical protein
MSRRLGAQGRRQVHRRNPSKNPKACEPCGQPSHLTRNTVAALSDINLNRSGIVIVPGLTPDPGMITSSLWRGPLEHISLSPAIRISRN